MTNQNFDNNASHCLFIGNRKLDDVIAADTKELAEIGGSFEAIADRMDQLVGAVEKYCDNRDERRKDVFKKRGYLHEDLWKLPGKDEDVTTERGKISAEIEILYQGNVDLPGERDIAFVERIQTRGWQECPFNMKCKCISTKDYVLRSKRNGKELWINPITSHLARAHHLLEKDNEYGTTPKEFYESFMPELLRR